MTVPPVGADGLVTHQTPAPFPFGPSSIAHILDAGVANYPERVALIDGDRSWTYLQLDEAVAGVLDRFEEAETCVQGAVESSADLVISVLAGFRAGTCWIASTNGESIDAAPLLRDAPEAGDAAALAHAPAAIALTSGTSGQPKKVVHSQHSLLLPALVSVDEEAPKAGERIGSPLDLRIANVMVLGPFSAFVRGSTFVVMRRRFATGIAEDIATHGVTRLLAVPTLAYDLALSPDVEPAQLQSLDRVILGGSGGDPDMQRRFSERFGVRPTLSYGLTEAPTGVVRESLADPIGSGKGHPLPHVAVVIVDPDSGRELPAGSVGEVCLRPATEGRWANTWTGTLGYLGDPDATALLYRGAMLHTGDLGSIDSEGRVAITGRLSNLIVRGGRNVDPTAVRHSLLADSRVARAEVVGFPDERLGQAIGAAVVLKDGETIDADALRISLRQARPDIPKADAIVIVDDLPRNQMGKVVLDPAIFTAP